MDVQAKSITWQVVGIFISGQPIPFCDCGRTSSKLADSIETSSSQCRLFAAWRRYGKATRTKHWHYLATLPRAEVANDVVTKVLGLYVEAMALSYIGDSAARTIMVRLSATELGGIYQRSQVAGNSRGVGRERRNGH